MLQGTWQTQDGALLQIGPARKLRKRQAAVGRSGRIEVSERVVQYRDAARRACVRGQASNKLNVQG